MQLYGHRIRSARRRIPSDRSRSSATSATALLLPGPDPALCAEVDAYLGRRRYDRADGGFSGYRIGFARDREITIGSWAVEVCQLRVARW